jgi:hypothetical protein
MVSIDRVEKQGRCILKITGEMHWDAARELFERVLSEDCSQTVVDFSGCEVEDRALYHLAEMLNQQHLNLAVQGLRARQLRLLEYLGASHAASP